MRTLSQMWPEKGAGRLEPNACVKETSYFFHPRIAILDSTFSPFPQKQEEAITNIVGNILT